MAEDEYVYMSAVGQPVDALVGHGSRGCRCDLLTLVNVIQLEVVTRLVHCCHVRRCLFYEHWCLSHSNARLEFRGLHFFFLPTQVFR